MRYKVLSHRLDWPAGTVLTTEDLAGCNIDALVQAGHLTLSVEPPKTPKTPAKPDDKQEQADA